ncbi:MAG: ATP-binding protein, partial [Nonomuraea sp.]|nr:ATP-binding protein [Nonomuraea sp.]
MEIGEARSLAHALQRLLHDAHTLIDESKPVPELVRRVTAHLGCGLEDLVCVTQSFSSWEHASLQRGVDAYLEARGGAEWFGVSGPGREHSEIADTLAMASRGIEMAGIGPVDLATTAVGPDETMEVVMYGMALTHGPGGGPVVVGVRGPAERYGMETCRVEVLGPSRPEASAAREEIERLTREHDVLRGQVLTFGLSEHRGNSLVTFLPRPVLDPEQVILPEGVLETIERHIVG